MSRHQRVLYDLFCGAGGAAKGYEPYFDRIVGVDVRPQPRYPYEFVQLDAFAFLNRATPNTVKNVHASPPCQRYSVNKQDGVWHTHPDYIRRLRKHLRRLRCHYVIENVPGSPLCAPLLLCGSMFDMDIRRHRLFECSFAVEQPACAHHAQGEIVGVWGHAGGYSWRNGKQFPDVVRRRKAMGIDWMTNKELVQAVPPRYTYYLGQFWPQRNSR